ncbi:Uncharacterised protein [uncultured Blautia sp.]|nr:Uncharacterised protein [uncultured Blautia sp.]
MRVPEHCTADAGDGLAAGGSWGRWGISGTWIRAA